MKIVAWRYRYASWAENAWSTTTVQPKPEKDMTVDPLYSIPGAQGRVTSSETLAKLLELVKALDTVHNDVKYHRVWTFYTNNAGQYNGPTYTDELDAARDFLTERGYL